ncbi:MAG: sulfite exporter TauE/SafE family protein, partial [Desulfobulbaceae bacterium]
NSQAADETKPAPAGGEAVAAPTITIDKNEINNGGVIKVSGKAEPGKPVYIEVWAEGHDVRASRFDGDKDKETGKRPYIFYITQEMPAFYKILVPKDMQPKLDEAKKDGSKWSYSALLKDLGADIAYSVPAKAKIDHFQGSLMASVIGSRGKQLPEMDEKETKKRSMQLVKARFRSIGKVLAATVDIQPDGSYTADLKLEKGLAPGKYHVVAVAGKKIKSEAAVFENKISFPTVYMDNAGTSMNLIYPFVLTLVIAIFGVLMGAGGGFIMNPLLVTLFPALPHTIVAGTVTPTVLFSQGSGIYNYSKIKFINWKLGAGIGCAMLLGGFIGPKLTEMITLEQFKFAFGWILIVLAGLMFWQTTPGYLEKNKKEQAILKEFKKRAEESAKGK